MQSIASWADGSWPPQDASKQAWKALLVASTNSCTSLRQQGILTLTSSKSFFLLIKEVVIFTKLKTFVHSQGRIIQQSCVQEDVYAGSWSRDGLQSCGNCGSLTS